jgi:hypothetical protein
MNVTTKGSTGKTIDLALTAQERSEHRLALRRNVTGLKMKMPTDRYEFREELKTRRVVLEEVLHQLRGATTAVTGQGHQGEAE